ncbi:hypothetical protein LX16_4487 [Stackebrandtia albiflava]|uniref:Uncharacterized protein n=1 Tax=Stackebrandtia albiflava TaxID=406432 RepID=A0A562URL5_9ACTN|nr:hypothetical protein LX16_4487 [Stackebrandtia albiflava]
MSTDEFEDKKRHITPIDPRLDAETIRRIVEGSVSSTVSEDDDGAQDPEPAS